MNMAYPYKAYRNSVERLLPGLPEAYLSYSLLRLSLWLHAALFSWYNSTGYPSEVYGPINSA